MNGMKVGGRKVVESGVLVLPPGAITFQIQVGDLTFIYSIFDDSLKDNIPLPQQPNPKVAHNYLFTKKGYLASAWDASVGNYNNETLWQTIVMHILESNPENPVREIAYTFATGGS